VTLSEIAADPRAKEGREFTAPTLLFDYKFDSDGYLVVDITDECHWHPASNLRNDFLARTDWHFIEPAEVEA
jgi:hypothetical protein